MGTILVICHSETGNTRKMAELVAEGARAAGKHAVTVVAPADVDFQQLGAFGGFAFGSPDYYTYMSGQMKTFFDKALPHVKKVKGKPFVSFVSHGGGGGAIDSLDKLGKAIGLEKLCDGVKSQGPPQKDVVEQCRKIGQKLAEAVS